MTAAGVTAGTAVLGTAGASFDLTARLQRAGGLRLVASADSAEYLDIRIDPAAGELVVDRDNASVDPRAQGGTCGVPCPAASVELRLVVDRSVAELYLPSGRALTLRFYPTGDAPWRIEARAGDGGPRLHGQCVEPAAPHRALPGRRRDRADGRRSRGPLTLTGLPGCRSRVTRSSPSGRQEPAARGFRQRGEAAACA
ncbi:GH32 C-terminal domain-containing protein [Streptomyces swartbergensis]|uniref:GH32 C-terminal domain-containing protein n=1 Tax=Streptomyces swartbergensis TaxID=487165 RepID=UPI0037FE0AA1